MAQECQELGALAGGLVLGDDPPALVGELVHPAGTSCLLSIALLPRSASHPQITSQWPEQHATNHQSRHTQSSKLVTPSNFGNLT